MVNIIVPDLKAKHGKSAFAAGERTEGNVWPAAKGGGEWGEGGGGGAGGARIYTADKHLPPESHFITVSGI